MCLLAGVAMAYGWGWRGSYGHEAGAMVPGALVAMATCLASGRQDWYRRCLLAGLFGAIGWAWGGTLTNMEHRLYILSDCYPCATYGFFGVGLVGLLWCGVGGGILALVFTRPRSELNRFIGPLCAVGSALLLVYLYFSSFPDQAARVSRYVEEHWHDGELVAAVAFPVVLVPYWFLRRQDRPATRLLLECTAAWWIGYLALTRFGGLELAPPYRSEVWAGVIGIQVALLWHHWRQRDRAAILFTAYAMLAGCIGFILALQIHVPFVMAWGPFSDVSPWKIAEESFGFFMGVGIAVGAGRLIEGRLDPAAEDTSHRPLDYFSVFVLLIVMMWMNLKHNPTEWAQRYSVMPAEPFAPFKPPFPQLEGWVYIFVAGVVWSAFALYCLLRYHQRRLALAPRSAFEKGVVVFVLIVGLSLAGEIALRVPSYAQASTLFSDVSMMLLGCAAVWMLLARSGEGLHAPEPPSPGVPPSDPSWKLGWKYWTLWLMVPLYIFVAGAIATAIVEEPWRRDEGKERHRFGPDATWRVEAEKQGAVE